MKKVVLLLPILVLLTGCGKIKIENYTLYITESEKCDYNTIYESEDVLVTSFCLDTVKLKTIDDKEIDLKEALSEGIMNIKDALDGQIKEGVSEDGTTILKSKEGYHRIFLCDKIYSEKEKIVIAPMVNYMHFYCRY